MLSCPLCTAQTIAAAFSHKSPFSAPLEKQDELERVRRALAAPAATTAAGQAAVPTTLAGLVGDVSGSGGSKGAMPAAAVAAAGLACGQQSDHLLLVAAFEMWRVSGAKAGDRAAAQVRWGFGRCAVTGSLYVVVLLWGWPGLTSRVVQCSSLLLVLAACWCSFSLFGL